MGEIAKCHCKERFLVGFIATSMERGYFFQFTHVRIGRGVQTIQNGNLCLSKLMARSIFDILSEYSCGSDNNSSSFIPMFCFDSVSDNASLVSPSFNLFLYLSFSLSLSMCFFSRDVQRRFLQLKFKRRALREHKMADSEEAFSIYEENLVKQVVRLGSYVWVINDHVSRSFKSTERCVHLYKRWRRGRGCRQPPSLRAQLDRTMMNVGNLCRKCRFEATQMEERWERNRRRRRGEPCKGYHKNALYRNKEVRNSVAN